MTRDDAAEILQNKVGLGHDRENPHAVARHWIDAFIALGMLKLEANSDWRFRLLKALQGTGLHLDINVLEVALDRAGLEIREKQNG